MTDASNVCGIAKFVERDIDMLIAEELRVCAVFAKWVMSDDLIFPAMYTNVSVVEDGSEADVVATFKTATGKLHRLFVEDKIDAILMPEQLERYVRRGEGEVRRGLVAGFSVLLFTPSSYLCRKLPHSVRQISFEEAAGEFLLRRDLRSQYRASLLTRALPLRSPAARDEQVISTDPYIKAWWDKVYEMLDREYPGFFIHKTRYPRSVYFAPETAGQAKYLRVDFKGHKGEVDLAFKNIPAPVLKKVVTNMRGMPGQIVANEKSSAIQVSDLQPFAISDGFAVIETKVRSAYKAAYELLTFWALNRAEFDRLTVSTD